MMSRDRKPNASNVLTERLALREPVLDDVEAVFAVHGDPATNRFNPAGPHVSIEASRAVLARWMDHWHLHGFGYWTVATRDAPRDVIGFGGVMYKNVGGDRRPNLYFRLRPTAWGKGYASELARAARDLAFEVLDLPEIVATVRPANLPSVHVLERLGMAHVGDVSDRWGASRLYALAAPAPPSPSDAG